MTKYEIEKAQRNTGNPVLDGKEITWKELEKEEAKLEIALLEIMKCVSAHM